MGIYASVSIVLLVKPDKVNLMSSCWMYFPKLSSQIVFEMCIQKFPGSHKCQFYWKDYLNWYKGYCRRKCTLSCSFRLFQFETDYLMTLRYINLVFVRKAMPYIWLIVLYKDTSIQRYKDTSIWFSFEIYIYSNYTLSYMRMMNCFYSYKHCYLPKLVYSFILRMND